MYPVRRLSVLTVIQSTHIQKTGKSNGIEMFDSNKKKNITTEPICSV